LAGHLLGELTGSSTPSTNYFLTTALGSVLAVISNTASSASLRSTQLYAPYGSRLFQDQSMSAYTTKGFTGQYNDPTSGLDYYVSRYYDPVAGVFLSADKAQGNLQGMNPYGYVSNNPETKNDPTGQRIVDMKGDWAQNTPDGGMNVSLVGYAGPRLFHYTYADLRGPTYDPMTDSSTSPITKINQSTGWTDFQKVWNDPHASWLDKYNAFGNMVDTNVNNLMNLALLFSGPEGEAALLEEEGALRGDSLLKGVTEGCGGGLSFTAATKVATVLGERAIGTLHVGDKVLAYNPHTHKMELEPVLHVWINHDNDLVDVTLVTSKKTGSSSSKSVQKSEVIHTNQRHPFLTQEQGFLPVSKLQPGMHILRADGSVGIVAQKQVVPGVKTMYNLEVAQDHTYTVGTGQWVVHNASCTVKDLDPLHSPQTSGSRPKLANLSDQDLLDSVNNPKDGRYIRINPLTGKIMDGNGRAYELLRRAALPGSGITPDTPIYYEPYIPDPIPDPWERPPGL
jgi:RHS repeat-associated protein